MKHLSGTQKLFWYSLIALISVLALSFFSTNQVNTLIVSFLISLLLLIARPVWLSVSDNRVRVISLGLLLAVALSFNFWQSYVEALTLKITALLFPQLDLSQAQFQQVAPEVVFAFVLIGLWIINNGLGKEKIISSESTSLEKDFPSLSIKQKLTNIAGAIKDSIEVIDTQNNWQSQFFTPLEAEVELIREKGGKKRKITNVFDAIKSSKGQTILLLGEPGSGKSVTLRKLCKEIAEESAETGRIPIYINLKDWKTNWDADGRPTTLSLMKFIEQYIGDNFNFIVSKFLFGRLDENSTVFEKLYETDRLYFIFDSFDEIPAILSSENNADIIHQLSEVIFKFLKSGRSQKAQGILASRLYKKPTREFITNTILELRPFSDEKIFRTLENLGFYSREKIREIFATRPDLVSMARNPFMAALLANYSDKNRAKFPESKKELFDDFVKNTINEKVGLSKYEGLDFDTVFQFAVRIADYMYNKLGDLEIDVFYLGTQEPRQPVKQIINLLIDTRVMRGGIAHGDKVSFVHRRFAEYFIINRHDNEYDLNSIGNLGKWHDALILYSEIAEEEEAARIANRAWDNIKDKSTVLDLEFINSFRFLIESFSFRKAPMKAFIGDLKQKIFGVIERSRNILELKLVVEGIGLLDNEDIDEGVSRVLQFNNSWLSETAIRSCRHLPRITKRLEGNILNYVSEMELLDFGKNLSALKFSFGLSQSFNKGRKILNIKLFETILFFILIIALFYYFSISGWFHIQFAILIAISLTYFTLKSNLSLNNAKGVLGIIFIMLMVTELARNGWEHIKTCDEPHLQILLVLLLAIIPIAKFSISYLFLRSKITMSDIFTVLTYFLLTIFLYFISINTRSFSKLFEGPIKSLIFTAAPFLFLLFFILIEHYNVSDFFLLKKIDKKQCNQREYIYSVLQSLKSKHFRGKFLSYLEFNVDYAIGEWPDKDIFNAYNDKAITRLAKLEEKWLKYNKL